MSKESFSSRHGFRQASAAEISVRHDAPYELRGVVVDVAYEHNLRPSQVRSIVCKVLRRRPDRNNWSDFPNIDNEVRDLLDECDWYKIYDFIEAVHSYLSKHALNAESFADEVNSYFVESGIGWQLADGHLEVRGPEALQETIETAKDTLLKTGYETAQQELHEALADLSRRPTADISGAVQHSMAALECVAREVSGDRNLTLGEIIKRNPGLIPRPLDEAVHKSWGFASQNARHISEGHVAAYEEAELIVGLCSTLSTYLARKHIRT